MAMLGISELKEHIDSQIEFNQSKNLFYKKAKDTIRIRQSTFGVIRYQNGITNEDLSLLVDYTAEKALQEFCRINQYFSFPETDVLRLKDLYRNLYRDVMNKDISLDSLSKSHCQNLQSWLKKTNPFCQTIYSKKGAVLESVVCSEYSPELQMDILHLKEIELHEPILDIGCGKGGNLVNFLRENNLEAYGIDRFSDHLPYIEKADWLNFNYSEKKWGVIISNLGFSNHFVHNHLREDGNFEQYAKKYMEILRSLKVGGCFCYAPDLPFIEKYLDKQSFSITKYDIKGVTFKASIIKRLK